MHYLLYISPARIDVHAHNNVEHISEKTKYTERKCPDERNHLHGPEATFSTIICQEIHHVVYGGIN
jgi:hypothetical protein